MGLRLLDFLFGEALLIGLVATGSSAEFHWDIAPDPSLG